MVQLALNNLAPTLVKTLILNKEIAIRPHSSISQLLLFAIYAGALTQCAPKIVETAIPIKIPHTFSDSGTATIAESWWTVFYDVQLNALVDTALAANFNLKTAWERLRAANAVIDRESAVFWPSLDGAFQGGFRRTPTAFEQSQRFQAALNTSYEVDLWGRIRSSVDAERYRAEATLADYRAAAISLSAEIVRNWFQLVEARSQVNLIEEQHRLNQQILDLLEARFGSGQIRGVDILRQRQLLASTREQQIVAESRAAVLEHQLAVLVGDSPQTVTIAPSDSLPLLPPLPQTGIPIDLVRRRPDVQSAYNQLLAADRDLAVAITNQYPRISIDGSVSTRGDNVENLFKDWIYSISGNLFAPIFLGGELRAEVDRAEAVKQQRLYEYSQTVLLAFREVEDALVQEQQQAERIEALERQLTLAQRSNEQLRIEYFNGLSTYLDVLNTLTQEQQLRRDLLTARLTLLEFRVALYRGLAGSISNGRETGI